MSISAIRPIQGQRIAWSPQTRRGTGASRSENRNSGPDTIRISPEALALSKTARSNTRDVFIQEVADKATTFAGNFSVLPRQPAAAGSEASAVGPGALAAAATDSASAVFAGGSFGKILRRELIKAISANQGFAGPGAVSQ